MRSLKHSGRRAFLRGMGGFTLALPFLEFTHGKLWAADTGTNLRFLTVFSHGGEISNHGRFRTEGDVPARHDGHGNIYDSPHHGVDLWRPLQPTEDLVLGPTHEALEPWRSKLLLVEGIDNRAAIAQDNVTGGGGHGMSNVTALTAAQTEEYVQDGSTFWHALGPSVDFVIAERLAARQPVPYDRIHLMIPGHHYGTPFYRTAYEDSYGEYNPAAAWQTLFQGLDPNGQPDPELLALQARRGSVLDNLIGQYERFKGTVSARDLQTIEAHLEHLRALEKELGNVVACVPPESTDITCDGYGGCQGGTPADTGPLLVKMLITAVRCGMTNVANLEITDILTPWTPAGLQVESGYGIGHSLGHYAMDVGDGGIYQDLFEPWLAEILDNRRWRIGLLAQLLEGLDDPTFLEGDRTILDNSLVYYTSEFRSANHQASNLPVLIAGSAGGYFRTGRFVEYNKYKDEGHNTYNYESDHSIHNLYTSFLQAMGEEDEHFGNDDAAYQGPLPELT